MKKIVRITRLTGKTIDSFPKVGWIGDRHTIVAIEKNERPFVLEACDIEKSEDLAALQEAGMDVSCYALIKERKLTARQATESEIETALGAGGVNKPAGEIGHVFENDGNHLITCEEYSQSVLSRVATTYSELVVQLAGDDAEAIEAWEKAENILNNALDKAMANEQKRLENLAKINKQREARQAENAKNKATHVTDLTGAAPSSQKEDDVNATVADEAPAAGN